MPREHGGIFVDSLSARTPYYNWTAGEHNVSGSNVALDSEHIIFPNPPFEVGLWSLLIKTTDSGGGTPTITPTLYYGINRDGDYYDTTAVSLSDVHGNPNFTSGGTFIVRLDNLGSWHFSNGFKIRLTRSANSALVIDHAEVVAI